TLREDSVGIIADTDAADGNNIKIAFDGDLLTKGEDSSGIVVLAAKSDVLINSLGSITTSGDFAQGIDSYSKGYTLVISAGSITTSGGSARGVELTAVDDGKIALALHGDVHTSGKTADAVTISAENGSVAAQINGDVIATGNAAHGLTAISDTSIAM